MDVLLIGGSIRPASHTGAVLREMAGRLERKSAMARVWDVNEHRLPPADPAYSGRATHHPSTDVRRLGQLASRADAFGIVSPVYHNSFSGAVKNTLDYLSVADFRGKPVALGSHGSPRSAVQGCDHLRLVIRGLHGVATVSQLASTDDDFTWTSQGHKLTQPTVVQRLDDMVDELLLLAHLLSLGRSPSLVKSLVASMSAADNGGHPQRGRDEVGDLGARGQAGERRAAIGSAGTEHRVAER
jgi:azobenzene reductase